MRVCLSLLFFTAAASAENDPRAVLETVRKAYAQLQAVSLVATQSEEVYRSPYSSVVESEYELAAKTGGKYRVRMKQGDRESLSISNGTKTWKALPASKQWSQIDAAGAAGDDDEDPAPVSQVKARDLRSIVQDMLIGRYPAIVRHAQDPEIVKEENYKLGKQKVQCVVLRVHVNDVVHDLWVDRDRGLVLQEVQTSHQKLNAGDATIKATIRLKQLATGSEVDDSTFQFEPERSWREVEVLILPGERSQLLNGLAAGDFRIKTLEGDAVQLSSFRGKVVVLDFWATWCPPCREELPSIEKLRAEFGDKVQFFGVNDEDGSTVKSFQRKHNYELTVLMDSSRSVHRQFGVQAIPTVLIVGPDGVIRSHFIGGRSPETLRSAILAAAH